MISRVQIVQELNELRAEHAKIKEEISYLSEHLFSTIDDSYVQRLTEIMRFMDQHHEREEKLLFPWLADKAWVNQGGPRCMYFMSLRLEGLSVARESSLRGEFKFRKPSFLGEGSTPLEIPLEEHQAAHALATKIKAQLSRYTEINLDELRGQCVDWYRLVEQHRQKEDECLFVMIEASFR
jgi:hemerythrin-like domain-containing protein